MFRQSEWIFKGSSGKEYKFKIYSKSSEQPEQSGIFILAYTHPRGHLSGFETHPLYIGQSDNLRKTLSDPPQKECVNKECWNCTYMLLIDDPTLRDEYLQDLIAKNQTACN